MFMGIILRYSYTFVNLSYSNVFSLLMSVTMATVIARYTVKILKFGTPQTIAIIVLKLEKFDVTLH